MEMDETIRVSTERIAQCINRLDQKEFLTADVIREYLGAFCSNRNTPARYSFNAQFGKIMKANATKLHIKEIDSKVSTKDDFEHPTPCSKWQLTT